MTSVRKRKSRRNRRINTTAPGRKLRKKTLRIDNKVLKKNWDSKKTLKENFADFGLVLNSNSVVKAGMKRASVEEPMDAAEEPKSTKAVAQELEILASEGDHSATIRHIAPGEINFLKGLMDTYGDNYKAMVRDKKNVYQQTANQLKRKCENLKKAIAHGHVMK